VIAVNPKDTLTKAPMVVLVNQGTSGASELVAGAIADNRRGQLVGLKTFGTGSFQKLIPMEDGWALLLSVAKYYTPSGKEIQQVEPQDSGIRPTVEVQQTEEENLDPNDDQAPPPPVKTQPEEDRQLKKALEVLKDPSKATATSRSGGPSKSRSAVLMMWPPPPRRGGLVIPGGG